MWSKRGITKTQAIIIAIIIVVAAAFGVYYYIESTKPKKVVIRFAMAGSPYEIELYKKYIPKFQEKYPYIEVKLESYPWEEYQDKMLAELAAGTAPDVIKLPTEFLPTVVEKGYLLPLDDFINDPEIGIRKEDFFPVLWEMPGIVYKGKTYAIPIDIMAFALYYNPKLFEEAGLDPDKPPKTWDELLEYAIKLTKKENGKVVQWGFGIPIWDMPIFTLIYSFGGDVWERDLATGKAIGPAFNKPPAKKALRFLYDMMYKYEVLYPPVSEVYVGQAFGLGQVAMLIEGPWHNAFMKQNFPDVEYRVAPLPEGPAGHGNCVFSSTFGIAKNSKHPKEAWLFIRFITSEEFERAWALEASISPPSRIKVAEELVKSDPHFHAFFVEFKRSGTRGDHPIPNYYSFRPLWNAKMQEVFNPEIKKDPDVALDELAEEVKKAVFGG